VAILKGCATLREHQTLGVVDADSMREDRGNVLEQVVGDKVHLLTGEFGAYLGWIVDGEFPAFDANRFRMWWPGTELNRRRQPFQGCALPPELPGHISKAANRLRITRSFASR
jgi:hypothetical protein